jgi:putative Ca2+/H+ antiporter (TMEM165/GDT1 family)
LYFDLTWCKKSLKRLLAPKKSRIHAQFDAIIFFCAFFGAQTPAIRPIFASRKMHAFDRIQGTHPHSHMEAFLISTGIVALAEMGDKTQLLSLVLAARFRKPWPIVLGILVATMANHGLAGAVGSWVTSVMGPDVLRWVLGVSFIAMAVWMLIPDKLDDNETQDAPRMGVFLTTVVAFFLAEMGDKTQIATVMLAAQYQAWFAVVAGTTLGMMLANAPVVWLGDAITQRVPLRLVHLVSAVVFAVLGVIALLGWGR